MNRHPYCEWHPKGWYGHNHSIKNPAKITLDYDYYLPSKDIIPKETPHLQWETTNFGWWCWTDKEGKRRLARY